jgi:hypothetical protein
MTVNTGIRKSAVALFLGAVVAFSSSAAVYAQATTSVTSEFETGLVNVALTEYVIDAENNKKECPDGVVINDVLPGQEETVIANIQNNAADCYVRLKQAWDDPDAISTSFVEDENWVEASDGYIYYTQVLDADESVDLSMIVKVNSELSASYSTASISQYVRVEAIQSTNFTPDFTSADPWGGVDIQDALYSTGYNPGALGNQSLTIQYQGQSKELVKNADDAFANFATLMPGDVYTDSLELSNTSSNSIVMYFQSQLKETSPLYDALQLKIDCVSGDVRTTIYDGKLSGSALDTLKLVEIASNKTATLEYTLSFPAEYDNAYTLMGGEVTWIFSTEEIIKDKDDPGTGDKTFIAYYLFAVGCFFTLSGLLVAKKKETAQNNAE